MRRVAVSGEYETLLLTLTQNPHENTYKLTKPSWPVGTPVVTHKVAWLDLMNYEDPSAVRTAIMAESITSIFTDNSFIWKKKRTYFSAVGSCCSKGESVCIYI